MKCPRCESAPLVERDRENLTLDVCTECRGIWLDRGELEKLLARAQRGAQDEEAFWVSRERAHREGRYRDDDDDYKYGHGRYGKKRGLLKTLSDIFD